MKDSEDQIYDATTNVFKSARLMWSEKTPSWDHGTANCDACGEEFPYRWIKNEPYEEPSECLACCIKADEERRRKQEELQLEARRLRDRIRDVPPLYVENDIGRFPPNAWAQIRGWKHEGGKGLGIVGPSGVCKTRMMFQALMNIRESCDVKFLAVTAFKLQNAIQRQWQDDESKSLIACARRRTLLFLDDLGKQKFTEAAEAELFDIIEERIAYKRPLLFTSNLVGADFEEMISSNVAGPLLRRLREFCNIILIKD